MMVSKWTGRGRDGWNDGNGIYESSHLFSVSKPFSSCQLLYKRLLIIYASQYLWLRNSLVSSVKMKKYMKSWQTSLARLMQNLMNLLRDFGDPEFYL